MAYVHAEIVSQVLSPDGKAKLDILKRHDGFYEFRGYIEQIEDGGPRAGDAYWAPVEYSGLYETKEEVERDALAAVPRPKLQNPN